MSRALAALVALAVSAVVLSGCAGGGPGSGSASPSGTAGGDAAEGGTLTVFAAASLTDVFAAIASEFEARHPGVHVVFSFGGSSGLAAQLTEGAPADVFAAASDETMRTVADAGLLDGEAVTFARNTLELAVPPGNPGRVTALADLARPELAIALCDPAVPCGAVAAKVLADAGVAARPDTLEQDVKAVLTKVRLGEVDAGLVYRTDVLAAGDAVEGVDVPEAAAEPTDYPIGVLAGSAHRELAREFVRFVGQDGRAALEEAGFATP